MNNFTAYTKLMDEGIIHEDGQINRDKINLLSGAFAAPLAEMLMLYDEDSTTSDDL